MSVFIRQLQAGLRALLIFTVLAGVLYPLAVLGVGQLVASHQAQGSLIERGGTVVGSSSLGQQVTTPEWFHGRPSAVEYAGNKSGGSNLGPNDDAQKKAVGDNASAVHQDNPGTGAAVPPDALTASASGLDPDISPEYATVQAARVATARGVPEATVRQLVAEHTKGRILGFIGEPRVNVTELNAALADRARP